MIILACKKMARTNFAGFATASEIAQKTYAKFQKRYSEQSVSFNQRMESIQKLYAEAPKPNLNQKIYEHPYESPFTPINLSFVKIIELSAEAWGPEQVSPHYQNFAMSRKWILTFWAGVAIMLYGVTVTDMHWISRSLIFPWITWFGSLYFFLEARKSQLKPFLSRFYRRIFSMEVRNLEAYYNDNIEFRVRKLMAVAKSQIEYKAVHNDYVNVRNDSLMNFLINEQVVLKNHINHRALNILKQAEAFEEINQRKIIDEVIAEISKSLQTAYSDNKEKIEKDMFELALKGLEKGEMDYANDPILPFVIEKINKRVAEFTNLTKEQQTKLVSLTVEQLQSIRNNDVRARDEFLTAEPKIDGTLKANPTVAKILANWVKAPAAASK